MRGAERVKANGFKALHINQKPLRLIGLIVAASTDRGDVVWEPFGGLCSAAISSLLTGRHCYSSEVVSDYFKAAARRLEQESENIVRNTRSTRPKIA